MSSSQLPLAEPSARSSSAASVNDPNFPPLLRIAPSSVRAGIKEPRQTKEEEGVGWDEDTAEDIEAFGIAGRIWEAAYLLRLYLRPTSSCSSVEFDPPCHLFPSSSSSSASNIIELGSGVGYVGLHFARQLAEHLQSHAAEEGGERQEHRVVLTDLDNVCPLLQRNASRAGFNTTTQKHAVQLLVRPLPWGSTSHATQLLHELTSTSSSEQTSLTLLCSDLVYFPALLAPLLRSLITLTHSHSTHGHGSEAVRVIIAYKVRSLTKEEPFWRAFGCWFEWDVVRCRRRRLPRRMGSEEQVEEDWERFGRFKWHLEGEGEERKEEEEVEEEEAEDEYFILSAIRRADSVGAVAPSDDSKLMSGWRIRPRSTSLDETATATVSEACDAEAEEEGVWEQGLGGEEFELLLMRELQSY